MFDRLVPVRASLVMVLISASACASDATQTRCSTTDDGEYPCTFNITDDKGSFEISAPGKPTYILNIEEAGVAYGFADFGDGTVPLPGRYLRSEDDRACWQNDATETEICAR